jgi:hypothetical protein
VLPELLKNVTLLDEVLTYHVVSGNVSSGQLKDGQKVPTVEGADLLINLHKGPNGQTDVIINQDSRVTYANNVRARATDARRARRSDALTPTHPRPPPRPSRSTPPTA